MRLLVVLGFNLEQEIFRAVLLRLRPFQHDRLIRITIQHRLFIVVIQVIVNLINHRLVVSAQFNQVLCKQLLDLFFILQLFW